MKKLGILLGLVVLTLVVALPKLMGLAIGHDGAQARLRELMAQPNLTLTMRSGWFSSQGHVQIEAPIIAGVQYPQARIDADLEITHGPVLFTEDGLKLGIAWVSATPVLQGLAEHSVLQTLLAAENNSRVYTLAKFDGSLHAQLHSAAFDYHGEAQDLEFADLHLRLDIQRDGAARLNASSSSVRMHSPLYTLHAEHSSATLDTASLERSPLPGALAITIETLHTNIAESLTMRGISLDYVAREQREAENGLEKLYLQQNLAIAQIESDAPLSALTIETQLNGVDIAVIAEYMRVFGASALVSGTGNDTQDSVLIAMLREAFEQSSVAQATIWGGEHNAELSLTWPGIVGLRSLDELTLARWIRLLEAKLHINADAAALAKSPYAGTVKAFSAQGGQATNNGKLEMTANLQGGSLILNGQRFPLEPFLNLGISRTP